MANKAWVFDGNNANYVSLGAWADHLFTGALSIDFWFYLPAGLTAEKEIISLGVGSAGQVSAKVVVNSAERLYFYYYDGSFLGTAYHQLSVQTWYHVACVFERNVQHKCYLNGVVKDGTVRDVDLDDVNTAVRLVGKVSAAIPGSVDELRFWNKALSSVEVGALYNAGVGYYMPSPTANVVAGYHCDNDFNDYSGNSYHGSEQGDVAFADGKVLAPPLISSVDPSNGKITEDACSVTISGSNFTASPAVALSLGATVLVGSNVTVVNENEITCDFDLTGGSVASDWDLTVTAADSQIDILPAAFDIKSDPQITSIDPATAAQGPAVEIVVTGTGFLEGCTTWLIKAPAQVAATTTTIDSSTQITATFDLSAAEAGDWMLAVLHTDGNGDMEPFTLTAASSGPTPGEVESRRVCRLLHRILVAGSFRRRR